ncbi:7590_t:CDS:2 [Ambispora gerdemannii]|uniref:7590_t:CDS:1 n=1 Tax=Ambispora gerdemannii TaxID=144530 RepID=A0A9N9B1Y8_9GLOM|nr:7590_t:CDS:2 [Ambispora gerdemannii]
MSRHHPYQHPYLTSAGRPSQLSSSPASDNINSNTNITPQLSNNISNTHLNLLSVSTSSSPPLNQREHLKTAKIPTHKTSSLYSLRPAVARSNSYNQQQIQNLAAGSVTPKSIYETARICLPNNTIQNVNLPVVPRESLEFQSQQQQPQIPQNLTDLNSQQVDSTNNYIPQALTSQYPLSSSYYSSTIYPDTSFLLVNNSTSEQVQNKSPRMNHVTGPIRRTPIIKQQSLAAAPYSTNGVQKQNPTLNDKVSSHHISQSIKPIANRHHSQITNNANTNMQQQSKYTTEHLSISDQSIVNLPDDTIIQEKGFEDFLVKVGTYESLAKSFSNEQNDNSYNNNISSTNAASNINNIETTSMSTSDENLNSTINQQILDSELITATNDIHGIMDYSFLGNELEEYILSEDGFDPIPDLNDNSNIIEPKKDIETNDENLTANPERYNKNYTNEFSLTEHTIDQLNHNLPSTSQLSDSEQSQNEGNGNSPILIANDAEAGNGESSRASNNDAILGLAQFLPSNSEAWEIASDNSGEQSQTHQDLNDGESFKEPKPHVLFRDLDRFTFFRAMRVRLDTLAKFIKGSFSSERSEGVGLWERIFPLIKQECTHIQRLIDATEWKSLDFPKSRAQFPLELVDCELMRKRCIPQHAGEFQYPLQIIKDGNDGFRAISILLNATEIGTNRDNFYEELRVRTVLTMINKQDSTRRLFDSHLDEVSMKGGNIKLNQIAREYYHVETLELMELLKMPSKSPDYDTILWQIEALRTCMDGQQIGVPQLLTMANLLKATIRIMYPNYNNKNFRVPIKCKGNSKRIFVITMLDPEREAEEDLLDYFITPLIRKIDIFEVIRNPDLYSLQSSDRQEQIRSSSLTNILSQRQTSQQQTSLKSTLPQNHHQHNYQLQSQQVLLQQQQRNSQLQQQSQTHQNININQQNMHTQMTKGKGELIKNRFQTNI